ncbi:MAG TPA: Rid family hydrolase [Opitutaceae bacterium]
MTRRFLASALALLTSVAASHAYAAEPIITAAVTYYPLDGAVYSETAKVRAEAALIFTSGADGVDAPAVFAALSERLSLAGATPADLVNVRGSLLVAAGEPVPMSPWNSGWGNLLGHLAHRPTRTTLGTVALATPGARFNAEGVAARILRPDLPVPGEATPNPRVRRFGSGAYGASAATLVLPGTALVFTAGILADPIDPAQPENAVARYGDMATQSASALAKLEQTLRTQNLAWDDIFYVRALLSPVAGETAVDFAGFGRAFEQAFSARNPLHRPALTVWTAPGFNATGRIVEIEVYAAAKTATPTEAAAAPMPNAAPAVRTTGAANAVISSSAAITGLRPLVWFAGVIGTGNGLHDEAVTAFLALRTRAETAGVSLGDTIFLRGYPVVGDDYPGNFARWNEAYGRFFNLPGINPHKPARTAFPVTTLPQDKQIEIEILAVGR